MKTFKIPKNRGNLFLVERVIFFEGFPSFCVIGVFPTYEGADNYKESCKQELLEKGFTEEQLAFSVVMSTYYDG